MTFRIDATTRTSIGKIKAALSLRAPGLRGSSHFYLEISSLVRICELNFDFPGAIAAICGLPIPNWADRTMWLPSPIYERVPQFWLLLGLLFFAFGLYLGFEFNLIFIYLGIGILCVARSAWVFQVRLRHRSQNHSSQEDSDSADEQSDHAPSY